MKIKVYFDFHDVFVDSKSAWIKAFKKFTNDNNVEYYYERKMPKKEICQKYDLQYDKVEKEYRKFLTKIEKNIDFAKLLSQYYKINILSLSRRNRLEKDLNKFDLSQLFDEIVSKEQITSKLEFLESVADKYDWVVYFNHDFNRVIQKNNILYIPVDLEGDLSKFNDVSFTEHAKNKLLYNELSKYYMKAIANDTCKETDFLLKLYFQHGLPSGGHVLDCCCGVGRHDYMLALNGFNVTGVDISNEQIKNAKLMHSHKNVEYKVMDVRNIMLPIKNYDMSICMWTTYNYLSQKKDFVSFIKSNFDHQHKNSILVLDSKNIPMLAKRRVYKRNNVSNDGIEMELIISKYVKNNIQNSQYLYFINDNGTKKFYIDDEYVRFYTLLEIKELVKDYYSIENVYGDFDFSKYDKTKSNRFIIVLKRK